MSHELKEAGLILKDAYTEVKRRIKEVEEMLHENEIYNEFVFPLGDDEFISWQRIKTNKGKGKFRLYLFANDILKAFEEFDFETKVKFLPELNKFVKAFTGHIKHLADVVEGKI